MLWLRAITAEPKATPFKLPLSHRKCALLHFPENTALPQFYAFVRSFVTTQTFRIFGSSRRKRVNLRGTRQQSARPFFGFVQSRDQHLCPYTNGIQSFLSSSFFSPSFPLMLTPMTTDTTTPSSFERPNKTPKLDHRPSTSSTTMSSSTALRLLVQRHPSHPLAKLPTRGSASAAGYDLYASENVTLPRGGRKVIATGISLAIPRDTMVEWRPGQGWPVSTVSIPVPV